MQRHTFCSFCGVRFDADAGWPRACRSCDNVTYRNPTPVAVALQPVDSGLLTVRRGIEPRRGMLALPGGYIDYGESWRHAAARELMEETGVNTDAGAIGLFDVCSAPDGTLLVFGLAPPAPRSAIPEHPPGDESLELVVIDAPVELAFPLHGEVVAAFFSRR